MVHVMEDLSRSGSLEELKPKIASVERTQRTTALGDGRRRSLAVRPATVNRALRSVASARKAPGPGMPPVDTRVVVTAVRDRAVWLSA